MKHNILVKDKNRERSCCEEKHLMDSLSVSADLVPKGCHNGACGICKIKVHKGNYTKLKMNRKHITEDEEMNDIVLACRSFPRSDMEIAFIKKTKSNIYTLGS